MKRQIRIGTTSFDANNVYPYRYDYGKGKQVLRIELQGDLYTFEAIKTALDNCTQTIEYYESMDDTVGGYVLKNEYANYSLDFNCQYANGVYSVEITRLTEQEQDIEALNTAVSDLALMLGGVQ